MRSKISWRALSILFLHTAVYAELPIEEYKGLSEHIQLKPGFQHLDPITGCMLPRQGLYNNIYNYSELPDPKTESSLDSETPNTSASFQPRSHWTEKFIQSVFNIPLGSDMPGQFQTSPLSKKMGKYLGPVVLGKMLRITSQHKLDPKNPHFEEESKLLGEKLKTTVENDSDFKKAVKESNDASQVLDKEYSSCKARVEGDPLSAELKSQITEEHELEILNQAVCHSCSSADKKKLTGVIERLDEVLKKFATSHDQQYKAKFEAECTPIREKRDALKFKAGHLTEFIKNFLASHFSDGTLDSIYPAHFTEQTLVALACMKAQNKAQYLQLYDQLPEEAFLKKESGDWLNERFTQADFDHIERELYSKPTPGEKAHYLVSNPELAAFFIRGASAFSHSKLPEIRYEQVPYTLPSGAKVSFADCMDSTILNFLAINLKNPQTGKFDAHILQQGKEHPVHPLPGLIEFIHQHPDISSLNNLSVHEKWVPLIEGLPSIQYCNNPDKYTDPKKFENNYEVDTTLNNLFQVMDHLLPSSHKDSYILAAENNEKRMDQLCKLFSREGHVLDWSIDGKKEDFNHKKTDVQISFTINGRSSFEWHLKSGHSYLSINNKDNKLEQELSNGLVSKLKERTAEHESHSASHGVLDTPFLAASSLSKDYPIEKTPQSLLLRMAAPLTSTLAKNELMIQLLEEHPLRSRSIGRLLRSYPRGGLGQIANYAIAREDIDLVKQIIKQDPDSHYLKEAAKIALSLDNKKVLDFIIQNDPASLRGLTYWAMTRNNLDALKAIHQVAPEDFMERDYTTYYDYPVVAAAKNGHWESVKWVAEHAPESLKLQSSYAGTPPALLAAHAGNLEVLEVLAKNVPESITAIQSDGMNLPLWAVQNSDLTYLDWLARKAPHALKLPAGLGTPVEEAIKSGNLRALEVIAKYPEAAKSLTYPNPNRGNYTPAHYAVEENRMDILKLIHSIDPNCLTQASSKGVTPIGMAAERGIIEIIEYAAKVDPKSLLIPDQHGNTPLWEGLYTKNSLKFAELLVQLDPKSLEKTFQGHNHLSSLVRYQAWDTSQYLLEHHPELIHQLKDIDWHQVAISAFYQGDEKGIEFMAKHMPKVLSTPDSDGELPAHYGIQSGKLKTYALVSKYSPQSISHADEDGRTIAHIAAKKRNAEFLELIAERNPEVFSLKDHQGKTPLELLPENEWGEAIKKMIKNILDSKSSHH